MTKRRLRSLEDCLWSAFTYGSSQEDRYIWAVSEGAERIAPYSNQVWLHTQARKKHECIRDCEILPGHIYFRLQTGGGWGNELKICVKCLAMILYFQKAYNLPTNFFTHWDFEEDDPVRYDGTD